MTLQINDTAPDFEAETTESRIRFHDRIGNSWAVLFSRPNDFTPVCTTELGYMARIKPEFDNRNVKISVDPIDRHSESARDIKETQGFAPNYPMIGDPDLTVAKLYSVLPASASGDASKPTATDNLTVRNVFVISPTKQADPRLPDDHRASPTGGREDLPARLEGAPALHSHRVGATQFSRSLKPASLRRENELGELSWISRVKRSS
jgi:alkyl hydroperoxide reductase subunit AhpC